MRSRLRVTAGTAASCLAVGIAVFALTATAAAPIAAEPRSHPLPHGNSTARVADFAGDDAQGIFRNLTPYTMTFVQATAPDAGWNRGFPKSLNPGEQFIYRLVPNQVYGIGDSSHVYDGVFTYKVDAIHGPEYLSLRLYGTRCVGICKDVTPLFTRAYRGTTPPVHDRTYNWNFGPAPATSEIAWISSGTTNVFPDINSGGFIRADFDYTFLTKGDYTVDASKDPPQLVDLLNSLCSGASDTSCEFTPSGPPTYGPGATKRDATLINCGQLPGQSDWEGYSVEVRRTAAVTAGGELTGTVEGKVFAIVSLAVSLSVGYEHEWSESESFKFLGQVEVPRGYIGGIWDAPQQGVVTGTLVVKSRLSSYTITNYRSVKDGVTPDAAKSPPFVLFTKVRKMTDAEFQARCSRTIRAGRPPTNRPPSVTG